MPILSMFYGVVVYPKDQAVGVKLNHEQNYQSRTTAWRLFAS